jgi:hypothetical protein
MNGGYVVNHNELAAAANSSSGTSTVDLALGNYFYATLTENITTVTFSNLPASGRFASWEWEVTQDAGASGYTITWPAAIIWSGGSAPTLTATASAVDVIAFWTRDGGTTIYASIMQDFA